MGGMSDPRNMQACRRTCHPAGILRYEMAPEPPPHVGGIGRSIAVGGVQCFSKAQTFLQYFVSPLDPAVAFAK